MTEWSDDALVCKHGRVRCGHCCVDYGSVNEIMRSEEDVRQYERRIPIDNDFRTGTVAIRDSNRWKK